MKVHISEVHFEIFLQPCKKVTIPVTNSRGGSTSARIISVERDMDSHVRMHQFKQRFKTQWWKMLGMAC